MNPPRPVARGRAVALLVLCLGQFMIVLDVNVVNVALPSIQRDLGFSSASLAWVINAYLITFAGFLLLAGRVGDLIGRKRVFTAGLVVFTAASAACGLAHSEAVLIGARLLQGLGAAMAGAVIVAIIAASFPEPRERATAIAIYSSTGILGGSVGLLAGGALTQGLSWHWIFFINLPIGAAAIVLGQLLIVPDEGVGIRAGVDGLGAVLITAALMINSYAIVEASRHGWGSTFTLGGCATAAALVALFIWRQNVARVPLIRLRIFRSRNVAGANVARGLLIIGYYAALFLLSLYTQDRLHYTPLATGLAFLPLSLMQAIFSLWATPRLISRVGEQRAMLPGCVLMIASMLVFARVPVHGSYLVDVLPGLLLLGVGAPLAFNPVIVLSMTGVPPADFGVASGMTNVSQQVGAAIGLSVVATVSATRARDLVAAGSTAANAAVGGDHLAFLVATIALIGALVVGVFVLRSSSRSSVGVAGT